MSKLRGMKLARTFCGGKVYHASKRDAQTAINHQLRGHHRHTRPDTLRAYHCSRCGGWHLTSKAPWGPEDEQ